MREKSAFVSSYKGVLITKHNQKSVAMFEREVIKNESSRLFLFYFEFLFAVRWIFSFFSIRTLIFLEEDFFYTSIQIITILLNKLFEILTILVRIVVFCLIRLVGWLVGWFYGISTFVGYLTLNPFLWK